MLEKDLNIKLSKSQSTALIKAVEKLNNERLFLITQPLIKDDLIKLNSADYTTIREYLILNEFELAKLNKAVRDQVKSKMNSSKNKHQVRFYDDMINYYLN